MDWSWQNSARFYGYFFKKKITKDIQEKIQVWRHSCISISRTTGKFKLIENGNKVEEKISNQLIEWMQKIDRQVTNKKGFLDLKNRF